MYLHPSLQPSQSGASRLSVPFILSKVFLKPIFIFTFIFFTLAVFLSSMASPSFSISMSYDIFHFPIEPLNDNEFLDMVNLSNQDLDDFLKWVFETSC